MQTPTLVAVDDYNVLYSHSNYHEWMNEVYRRQVQPHELRLASAFKLFERQVCTAAQFHSRHQAMFGLPAFWDRWTLLVVFLVIVLLR